MLSSPIGRVPMAPRGIGPVDVVQFFASRLLHRRATVDADRDAGQSSIIGGAVLFEILGERRVEIEADDASFLV